MHEFLRATPEHVEAVAARVRKTDDAVNLAVTGRTTLEELQGRLKTSPEVWTWIIDGEPVAIFGLDPYSLLGNVWHPWLVATDAVEKSPMLFLKTCKKVLPVLMEGGKTLLDYADSRDTRVLNWLRWLGFTIFPEEPYGVSGVPFHRCELR